MTEKWDKKKIAEYAEALRSPFDGVNPNGQKTGLASGLEKLRELVGKKKETL